MLLCANIYVPNEIVVENNISKEIIKKDKNILKKINKKKLRIKIRRLNNQKRQTNEMGKKILQYQIKYDDLLQKTINQTQTNLEQSYNTKQLLFQLLGILNIKDKMITLLQQYIKDLHQKLQEKEQHYNKLKEHHQNQINNFEIQLQQNNSVMNEIFQQLNKLLEEIQNEHFQKLDQYN
jgi:hypothetical protein